MKKRTIQNIDCYGSVSNSDYFLVADEMDELQIDNWLIDRKFKNWGEVINYLSKNFKFYGDIQQIIAE